MGTETLSVRLLEPEKKAFKDGNPTFKIMTKKELFTNVKGVPSLKTSVKTPKEIFVMIQD